MQVDYQGPVIGIVGPHMMVIHASRVTKAPCCELACEAGPHIL